MLEIITINFNNDIIIQNINLKIENVDCIKFIKKLKKDNPLFKFDAVITDPPYNISHKNNFYHYISHFSILLWIFFPFWFSHLVNFIFIFSTKKQPYKRVAFLIRIGLL